jgi:AraC family transcriptional regulator
MSMNATSRLPSFQEWTMGEHYSPYLVETRAAEPSPLRFFATRQREAISDPATSDLVLNLVTAGMCRDIACDFGHGRFRSTMRRGELAFAPAHSDCQYHGSGPFELLLVAFPHSLVRTVIEPVTERDFSDFAGLHARAFQDPQIEQLLRQMWCEAAADSPHGQLYLDGALTMLLARLLQLAEAPLPGVSGRSRLSPLILNRVLEYLNAHLDESLGLDDLAHVAHVSRFHFARLFKRSTGETPYQYLTRRRLEEAQRQLRDTNASVLEIALAVGFSSAAHFANQFKRQLGVTPSAFRSAS